MPEPTGPLAGIRVLELGQLIAGTYGGMLLADLGADVIKVEPPSGDIGRNPEVSSVNGHSALFMTMNRGKRSVVIDLKSELGVGLFYRLVARSDVVVANYRPGVLERLRIDHSHLRTVNPDIIVCDISGFSRTMSGPQPPSFDLTHQAMSGLMDVTGETDGAPVRVGMPISDMGTAMFAALGVVSALVRKLSAGSATPTGGGSDIDLNMLHTTTFLLGYDATMWLNTGVAPRKHGSAHAYSVPWQAFESADGWIVVAVREDKFWRAFCACVEMPDLLADDRFGSNVSRVRHRDVLVPLIAARMRTRTTAQWLSAFSTQVPVAPVRSVAEALTAADHIVDVPYSPLGSIRMMRNPLRFDGAAVTYRPPPALGEHTAQVLTSLADMSPAEVDDLARQRIVHCGQEGAA
jgi:crotonobetainyl-CoA:carnitine CoA-transferase CaiB-like acyl-CoA transferase